MAVRTCLMILLMAAVTQERGSAALDTNQEMVVRRCGYDETPKISGGFTLRPISSPQEVLGIPEALSDLYRKHPSAVLDLLVKIIDGGNPNDSVLAAAYALALLDGPGGGIVCVDLFKKGTYDKVEKAWETTPRKHWMRVLVRRRKQRKR